MAEAEGVIQFNCCLAAPNAELPDDLAQPLLAWRAVLRRLELIGQGDARYGGLGYGNISRRVPGPAPGFVITASQTSGLADAGIEHLVWVKRWDLGRFQVEAEGALPPSSESLTHAMIYAGDPEVHWVLHGHCPDIWRNAEGLGLAAIGAEVGYGSPQMAEAVAALLRANSARPLVFVTLGHEDGVFACGGSAEATGGALVATLAQALEPRGP